MATLYTKGRIPCGKDFERAMSDVLKQSADNVEAKLDKVVATSAWVHVERTDTPLYIEVRMGGKTAEWLVRGTKPRTLPRKSSGAYVFQPNYQRKTVPRQFTSRSGGPSGEKVFSKGPIRQSGTEAGQWPGIAAMQERPILERNARAALRRLCK